MAEEKEKVLVEGERVRPTAEPPKTEPYKLKAGMKHFHEGRGIQPGEEIGLTPEQVVAFGDKFDKVGEEPEKRVRVGPNPDPSGDGDGAGAVGASHVPQDIGASTRDPQLPNINPGNDVPMAGAVSGQTVPSGPPPRSAANTQAATGSPLSPPATTRTQLPEAPTKIDRESIPGDATGPSEAGQKTDVKTSSQTPGGGMGAKPVTPQGAPQTANPATTTPPPAPQKPEDEKK